MLHTAHWHRRHDVNFFFRYRERIFLWPFSRMRTRCIRHARSRSNGTEPTATAVMTHWSVLDNKDLILPDRADAGNRATDAIRHIRLMTLATTDDPMDYDPAAYITAVNAKHDDGVSREFGQWHAFASYMHASSAAAASERRELFQWIRTASNYEISLDAIYVDAGASGMAYAHFVLASGRGSYGVLLALEVEVNQREMMRNYVDELAEDRVCIPATQFYSGDDPGDSKKTLSGFQLLSCRLRWFAFCKANLA